MKSVRLIMDELVFQAEWREYQARILDELGDDLRMVILADYIRKVEFPSDKNDL
ncbi:MAG: hypothetical protein GY804_06005 [Alphaproteobacteria bacterium]|nr:hypothetical protein [Alphaproteobacteria bacterium]